MKLDVSNHLIMLGFLAPVAMLIPIVISFFVPDYNWLSQHMSELQLRNDLFGASVHAGAFLAGVALLAFAVGALLKGGIFTALTTAAFGVGMITNGLFPTGSPMHGFYGIAIFLILTPPIFVGEFKDAARQGWFRNFSYLTAVISLVYMWFLLLGLNRESMRGLTQRVATLISFGWYAVAAKQYLDWSRLNQAGPARGQSSVS